MTTYGSLDGSLLAQRMRDFAARVSDESPLYGSICATLASDPVVAEVLASVSVTQPPANILLAAVQFMLLDGHGPELANHYPSLRAAAAPGTDPVDAFRGFCAEHTRALATLAASHTVQTNEVRRCAGLLASFNVLATEASRPLALIEVGASAGLNLRFDAYRYDYGDRLFAGPADAAVSITTELRGNEPPVNPVHPSVEWRIGVDLDPVDVRNPDDVRWARALLWPEQLDRIARFETAVADAITDPPTIVRGDGVDLITELAAAAPDHAQLCVFHSYTFNQVPEPARRRFEDALCSISSSRSVDRLAIEFGRDLPNPTITRTHYRHGEATHQVLADVHHHGAWLGWRGRE